MGYVSQHICAKLIQFQAIERSSMKAGKESTNQLLEKVYLSIPQEWLLRVVQRSLLWRIKHNVITPEW